MTVSVVIVEDNREIAEFYGYALRGHVDSLELLTEDFERTLHSDLWQGVTCAVIDLMLPHLAGEDICRYLRDNHPNIRRVICTAKPVTSLVELLPLAHVILQKPFSTTELVEATAP